MIITRRLAAGACALLAALAGGVVPAQAADGPSKDSPKVELVLDVSGSMRARDIDGQSRMAAAQQAFNEVIDATPEGVRLGIRTLGAHYPGDDKAIGCRDSKQEYRVGQVDRTEAKAAVATLRPTGWTPIGYALRGADQDLGEDGGTRRIVLITDGEDSCGQPDPCDVARELAAKGTHLTIDTLGLAHDDKTREQLTCIAEATGGTYTTVRHTKELSGRIKQLVRRSETPVDDTPKPTKGADACSAAPEIGAGVWTDRETFGEHRWYKVKVKPGQELRAAASVGADRPVDRDYGILVRAVGDGGQELVRGSDAGNGRTDVMSSGLRYPVSKGKKDSKDDADARTVCLEVSHSFSAPASVKRDPGLPVELAVDLVKSPDKPSDMAAFGLGRGWVLLAVLVVTGLVAGLLWGWLARWRVAIWRAN
ncbi:MULTISPECIES: VWA domain-containing protein [Streptomyces]|uniref:VWA domain-containing protein n=1 Tax=Streptomyces TaxID=1883 RepID=UPI00163C4B21|nr:MULTISPECIES: VWA domain-containing protein [Streptomyces]MBC2876192.1 VWA domain-containing protein [Streptomyces sp. TYQ1024]UBI35581.1 VWA domain-containing protein [Streptomyces mobaraensis]UKW28176.1 VWA domain-containing protein [Streptomyces sp. TYQ1024]